MATKDEMLTEARELHGKAGEWIDNLVAAGVAEQSIASAMVVAATDRVIASAGVSEAQRWLRAQADALSSWRG